MGRIAFERIVFVCSLLLAALVPQVAVGQGAARSGQPAARAAAQRLAAQNLADRPRPRVIVTSDVEIDDVASWHRFWLYANEFDVEGLISSSSRFHWAGDPAAGIEARSWAGDDVLEQMLKGYGRFGAGGGYAAVYQNLRKHDPRYPSPEELLSKVRLGNITNVGEMAKNTPGSELIKASLLSDKPGPLYLQAWGGTNTIAAALRSIEDQYKSTPEWARIYAKVIGKARLYIILDQDATYKEYIVRNWPDLYTIYNRDMFWSVAYQQFRNTRTPQTLDQTYFGPDFMRQIVQGPMLETYPLVRENPAADTSAAQPAAPAAPPAAAGTAGATATAPAAAATAPRPPAPPADPPRVGSYTSEGDSPSYWYVLPTGLRSEEDPSFGGWGGRFVEVSKHIWTDRPEALRLPGDRVRDAVPGFDTDAQVQAAPQTRWIPALQNDFLARARWTYTSPDTANHEPVVRVTRAQRDLSVRPGRSVTLTAQAADPDGDALTTRWWQYREAGTYAGSVRLAPLTSQAAGAVNQLSASLTVPADAKAGDTVHVIAEVSDGGTPVLTRYARFVLTVR